MKNKRWEPKIRYFTQKEALRDANIPLKRGFAVKVKKHSQRWWTVGIY